MLTDIQIAQSVEMKPIMQIATEMGLMEDEIELYGRYKAKINKNAYKRLINKKDGKLVLVTAINPTPAGEGKTTTTVGLSQALCKIGKNSVIAIREPSLGPVFGIKGGACGGGYSQVVPMEDINLHFTGDIHAVTAANNLLCAIIDNHIQHGNELKIDSKAISVRRCLDMNDRTLRNVVIGLGGKANGVTREDGFNISVASEIMAVLCLSDDLDDLKNKIGNMVIAYNYDGLPVFCKDLAVHGALTALLKDAIKPNLVQTLEGTPCFIHGGPFANIAHGCNSVMATKLGLKLTDYLITEAGFGSDLGAEKFFDIKCRKAGLKPDCAVLVTTVRALKYNANIPKDKLWESNVNAVIMGLVNLKAHIENINQFGVPVVVAINKFDTDTMAELNEIFEVCKEYNVEYALSEVFTKGGDGGIELAECVARACEKDSKFKFLYDTELEINEKIETIAKNVYGAKSVSYSPLAKKNIERIKQQGFSDLPVCVAKTQYSLSDKAYLLGRPKNFEIDVTDVRLSAGAGFIVIILCDIMTMPGLPKKPSATVIDIDNDGNISGLF